MQTSASAPPGSGGRRDGTPRACHQYDTSPLCMLTFPDGRTTARSE
jgi:hypothetical protein